MVHGSGSETCLGIRAFLEHVDPVFGGCFLINTCGQKNLYIKTIIRNPKR